MRFFKNRKDICREDGKVYLSRWNLFECSRFSIKIHRIYLSDFDCPHDHPWEFWSLILWGGYVEHRQIVDYWKLGTKPHDPIVRNISKIYHPFSFIRRKAEDRHRLEIHQPATTLVITFKKTRQWGFWTKKGFVKWFNYNSNQSCE